MLWYFPVTKLRFETSTEIPTFCLARLPKSFVELYSIVNKVKGRDDTTLMDDADDIGSAETAICLLSGAVMRSGSSRRLRSVRDELQCLSRSWLFPP